MPERRAYSFDYESLRDCFCYYSVISVAILFVILALIVSPAAVFFTVSLAFTPDASKFTITNASLSQFSFTNTNTNTNTNTTLQYNLELNITIRNPNRRVDKEYRIIQVIGTYRNNVFANVRLSPFYQPHKNTTAMQVVLQGQQLLKGFGEDDLSKFNSETVVGVYSLAVMFNLFTKNTHVIVFKTTRSITLSYCNLRVPLTAGFNQTSAAAGFNPTMCRNIPPNQKHWYL